MLLLAEAIPPISLGLMANTVDKSEKPAEHPSRKAGCSRTHFQSVIIAVASEDMTSEDMITWISPLLKGMTKQSWSVCVFNLAIDNTVSAQIRTSFTKKSRVVHASWPGESASNLRRYVPSTEGLFVIFLNDSVSQVFTLLDAVADWLCIMETNQQEVRDLCQLVEEASGAEPR